MTENLFSEAPSTTDSTPQNLSKQIAQTLKREPGDEIRCVHIVGDKYRCNWWAPSDKSEFDNPSMKGGQLGTTFRIRKSSFLRVTRSGDALKIVELPS
jgi:hypothetical protein